MASAARPPRSWALLDRRPRFHNGGVTVDARSAPATSSVALPHPRIGGSVPQGLPYVLAADKAGGLLLSFTKLGDAQAQAHPDLAVLTVDKATLLALPPRQPPVQPIARPSAIGFMPTPRSSSGDRVNYLVAELQPIARGRARLITVSIEGGDWVEREVLAPHADRPWGRDGVLFHGGMIWWADLSWGLVCCDPLARAPRLRFVKLPGECSLEFAGHPAVPGRRILGISDGHIRYLQVSRVRDGPSRMTLWTLRPAPGAAWNWEQSAEASFTRIWAGETYARTRLPSRLPTLAAINPLDPDMACVHIEGYFVGLHLASNRVAWVSDRDPGDYIPWEISRYHISSGGQLSGSIGQLNVKGFRCSFSRSSPFSTCIHIRRLSPSIEFSIRVWHQKYAVNQLELVQQFAGSGSVLYSGNADEVAVSAVVVPSLRQFILYAPVPDLHRIFDMFGIPADAKVERHGMVEDFIPTGKTRVVGSIEDEKNNRVILREHDGAPYPILMLDCRLGDVERFGIQLCSYLSFHKLTVKTSRHGINTVSLKVKEDSMELKKTSEDYALTTYIPLPYLAKVATLFP